MNTQVNADTLIQTGPLAFTSGNGVTAADIKKFCQAVNTDAKGVSLGLVDAVKRQQVKAQAKESSPGNWRVQVGTLPGETSHGLKADPEITVNINVTASTNDIPVTINALNNFFGNWHTVAGLIATGAAYVAGRWLLTVIRQP